MQDKEFYERWQKFMCENMGAFAKWNTDIGELNDLMMELERRIKDEKTN